MQQTSRSTSPEIPEEILGFLAKLDELVADPDRSECEKGLCFHLQELLKKEGLDLPYQSIVPDVDERGYGRLQVGVGVKSDIELVLVQIPEGGEIKCHTHCGWAVVMVLEGIEDNQFYVEEGNCLRWVGHKVYNAGEVGVLDGTVAHEIKAPQRSVSLHIYNKAQDKSCGADFIEK